MEVVSLKMSAVFDDGNGRLFPGEMPFMMVPACLNCFAPAMDCKCEHCGLPYCSSCVASSHTCQGCTVKTPSENTPRTIIEECESGDSGSTKELVVTILQSLYEQIKINDYVALDDDNLLAKSDIPLGECLIQDEFVDRFFGTCVDDFKRLCQNACCDYPEGMMILNVDRERALILSCNFYYEPQYVGCYEAIEWFKKSGGGAIGLIVKKAQQDKVICEIFEVLQEAEDFDSTSKSDHLLSIVRSWE